MRLSNILVYIVFFMLGFNIVIPILSRKEFINSCFAGEVKPYEDIDVFSGKVKSPFIDRKSVV